MESILVINIKRYFLIDKSLIINNIGKTQNECQIYYFNLLIVFSKQLIM